MVQQTKDSTFTEYALAHGESGLSSSDKQLSVSLDEKKSELQDSCSQNPMMLSEPIGSPLLLGSSEGEGQVVKSSGIKRPLPECLLSPPKSNAGSGHIVYVRRKPEKDLTKSNIGNTKSDVEYPHLRKSTDQGETSQKDMEINQPTSDVAPLQSASSPSFSSTRRSVSPSLEMSSNLSSPDNNKHVQVNRVNPSSEVVVNVTLWEERYFHLQSVLKMLDQSSQCDYVQMLRSLSSVELSKHAVELEKRSIKLSLEEAKEMQRIGIFDVLGKYRKSVSSSSPFTQQEQLEE